MDFSDRIRSRMQALQLSSAELAQLVGVSKGAVTHWTNGTNQASGKRLIALAKALECDIDWLANGGTSVAITSYAEASQAEAAKDATTTIVLAMLKKHAGKSLNAAAKQRIAQAVAESLESSVIGVGESPLSGQAQNAMREDGICITHFDVGAQVKDAQVPADLAALVHSITLSQFQLERLGLQYTSPANLSVITAWGQSMEGTINDKDLVLLDRGINEYVGDGIYLVSWAEHLFIRRMQLAGADQLELVADSPTHKGRVVPASKVTVHAKALLVWKARKL